MKKGIWIILAVIVVLGIIGVVSYNSLISVHTTVSEKQANIDTQLQRRADLIPNLVNTVKGYAKHEKEIFEAVAQARQALMSAGTMEEKAEANAQVSSALGRLFAVAENYPELKADKVYVQLMDELSGTENRISYAREEYNGAVSTYNQKIRRFPGVLFAGMLGFSPAQYFEAESSAATVPSVDFG